MKNKIKIIVSFFTVVFMLSSCLKDTVGDYWKDDLAGKMYATVPDYTLQSLALKPVPGEVTFSFLLNIATDVLPDEDITLTLAVDPGAVTQYNTDHSKSYKTFPTIQVLTPTVVILKGTRNASGSAKVWGAEVLNACDNFMTAITITSAKTASGKDIPVAGNMKSYLLSLPISNPFAGDYHAVGYRVHPTSGTFTVNTTETASTIDCKTIRKGLMGDYPYTLDITVTDQTMVVNGATVNKVTLSTPDVAPENFGMYATFTGDPATSPAAPSAAMNYYNPVTKVFVLNYFYLSAGAARKIFEILTRL